jgi:alpha-beta hydrolase superfamily lysophospholipase
MPLSTAIATQHTVETFTASDGYRLQFRRWCAKGDRPLGYVVALHGIQSHSGWYGHSSSRLAEAGYDVWFLDRRGSGLNREARGDAPHEDRLLNDVAQFLQYVRSVRNREAPAGPVVLLAVSWGGKLAAVTTAKRPELVDALALLYPGICARVGTNWWQKMQLSLAKLAGIRDKRVRVPLDDPALFTADAHWQQFIREDPLALHEVTVSFLLANRELDRLAGSAPERIRCPVLLMLAGSDRMIDNDATRRYLGRMSSSQRDVQEYAGAQHTLEFEPVRDRFISDVTGWLNKVRSTC